MPENPEVVWKQLVAIFRELLKAAEAGNTVLAIEASFSTFVGTVDRVRRMLEEVASPRLKILWDAAHLIQAADLADTGKAMARAAAAFGEHIVLAHANDVRLGAEGRTESCRAGTGSLDYRTFVMLLGRLGREVALCIEHAKEDEVAETVKYVARFTKEA
jgi:sugar phosphate isomerase/epimerase